MARSVLLLLALGWIMHAARVIHGGPESDALLAFGFLLLAALLAGRLVEQLGAPKLVGFVLAGLAAGPLGLGLVSREAASSLGLATDLALGVLALGVGCRLDLARIRPLPHAAVTALACLALAAIAVSTHLAPFAMLAAGASFASVSPPHARLLAARLARVRLLLVAVAAALAATQVY